MFTIKIESDYNGHHQMNLEVDFKHEQSVILKIRHMMVQQE